jgi:O-antigen ligase
MIRNPGFYIRALRFRLIIIFAALIPCSSYLSIRLLLIILLITLITDYKEMWMRLRKAWEILIYISILIVGLIYTTDLDTGWRMLETSASLLILPMAFPTSEGLSKSKWIKIIIAFIFGLFIALIICLISAFINYLEAYDINNFLYYNLTEVINAHPTYIAYYLIFSISWLLHSIFFELEYSGKIKASVLLLFLFTLLLLTGGQTAFISLLLVFSFFILKFLLEKKSDSRKLIFILVSIMLMFMFVFRPN